MDKMNLVGAGPVEWACDCHRGFFGYSVHIDNGVWPEDTGFPAFTHEQMLECKRISETLGKKYSFDSFPWLLFDGESRTWSEVYYADRSDVEDVLEPFTVDGVELYALGYASGWAWAPVSDGCEYEEV